jgi:transcriptional regulator with XRE-family HTH domain
MQRGIALIVKLTRVAQGKSQRDLAADAGVSKSLITKIEAGKVKNPGPEVRLALARALDMPPELLATKKDIDSEEVKRDLVSTLVRCGVSKTAAVLIAKSVRSRAREEVGKALHANE